MEVGAELSFAWGMMRLVLGRVLPLILAEDADVLVVHKPSGINTHKPDRFAPDGLHEWLLKRGWKLSILHRLDKETSGVLVFGKSMQANQALTRQFTQHKIKKEYLFLSTSRPKRHRFCEEGPNEQTWFEYVAPVGENHLIKAEPVTGKTHQIRRHAATCRFPVLGDSKYGDTPAPRLMLHAHRITFVHPATNEPVTYTASIPAVFEDLEPLTAAREFRELLFDPVETNAFRLVSGVADGLPGVIVDDYAGCLFAQRLTETSVLPPLNGAAVYEQLATKQSRSAPVCTAGEPVSGRFPVRENGLTFLIGFGEGLSTGIFLDQRENRRRLLQMPLVGKRVLNCFAYTCAFSVAAAKAGAVTTSVDLSRNYLEWGKENFRANELDPEKHDFVFGDVFEWLKKFAKRGDRWDVVLLDPPTFATTKKGRSFRAERDYAELAVLAAPLVAPGGTLFCSSNQRTLTPENFERAIRAAGRAITALEFATVPFDYRLAEGERPYLKTWWATLE
ncbi:MAG: Ribosomal RNA large subunit methyltransferase K/L [Verrucomicrobiae bacterium]|nr:Ribosomal RNA large subunit methyltransferase K/L [Verrucomicrobiae bacterium]